MAQKKRNPARKKREYWLDLAEDVQRQLDRLPGHFRRRIKDIISSLADDPRPAFAQSMRGYPDRYRLTVDEWRIVYRVDDEIVVVEVLKVGKKHGPEFYAGID